MVVPAKCGYSVLMPLKPAEFVVLAVLCDGELHGSGIQQAVFRKTNGGLILRSTGLYGTLRVLTRQGFIDQIKKPHNQPDIVGDRTYYRITQLGRQIVQNEAEMRAKGL